MQRQILIKMMLRLLNTPENHTKNDARAIEYDAWAIEYDTES